MIALASSLILELRGGRFRKVSEPLTQNRRNPHARSARSIIARGRPLHLGQNSAPMKSNRRLAQAEWERCIVQLPVITVNLATVDVRCHAFGD